MNLVRASLQSPYVVMVFVLGIVVLGLASLRQIPADLLPIYKTPAIQILTLYPGMPPEVVERDMTSRLERWTGQSVGIEHQEARSMLGVSIVKDFFREDIDPDMAMAQVTSLAMSDMFYLPPGTLPPMIMPFDPTASVPLCLLAVSSETMTEKELYDRAYYDMRNQLQSIQGVIAPAVYGGKLRRILAYVDRDKLEVRGLSPMDVVRGINKANPFVPTGTAKIGTKDYFVLSNAMVEDPKDLNDAPLRIDADGPVLIRDVGDVRDASQIQSNIVRINGRRQVYIPIYRQPGANTLAIVDEVKAKSDRILARIKEFYPNTRDMRMDVVMDQSRVVRGSIGSLVNNALIGALFVGVIVFLFLGSVRSAAIVLTAIPLAFLGAFAGLFFTGDTINSMTLGGLSLAIGILVDQAIVVTENISRHLQEGKTRLRAAYDGAREVAMPILVSTLTFIVVFYPVVFLSGMAKFLFTPLAVAVTFATIVSFFGALTFVPLACSKLLVPTKRAAGGLFHAVSERYRGLVDVVLKARYLVVAVAIGSLVAALLLGLTIGTELFPPVDSGQFTVHARMPTGTRLEVTEARVKEIEQAVQAEVGQVDSGEVNAKSDTKLIISNIGVLYDWPAAYTPNTGPMDAFMLVQLKPGRRKSSHEHASALRKKLAVQFPDVQFSVDTGGMLTAALNFGLPSPIDFKIQGSNLQVSHEIARAISDEIRKVDGAVDVRIAQPIDYPALRVTVDRVRAAHLGVTQEDVIKNVAAALNSSCNFAPSYWISPKNGNHYLIGAQYEESEIKDLATLENIPITGLMGKAGAPPVLLKNVARITRTVAPSVVDHRNITRTIDVYANVEGQATGAVAAEMERRLAESPRLQALAAKYGPKGYTWEMWGEIRSMRESFGQFATGLLIAVVLVYLVLVAQFRSFALPFVIMLTVPLGLIGVIAALVLTGTNFGIPAFMGVILMVGVVVAYSVLFVDFCLRRQRAGADLEDAVKDAARDRLRPILMTAATTACALIPMALGIGEGAEANAPLARTILGAVVGGSLLTLIVVPALYASFAQWLSIAQDSDEEEALA